MEITLISAQGLKSTTTFSLFSRRLRPFTILTAASSTNGDKPCHVFQSRVDDHGGTDPTWGDKFHVTTTVTLSTTIRLQIFSKRLIVGPSQLGWCQIPVTDVLDGFPPVGSIRHLSYRLRARDGTRGYGVVNVAVKLLQPPKLPPCPPRPVLTPSYFPATGRRCRTAVGIPVSGFDYTATCMRSKAGQGMVVPIQRL